MEVPSEPPRLIVDGLIRVDESQSVIPVLIKVSLTGSFFGEILVTELESIQISVEIFENGEMREGGSIFLTEEEPGTGIYVPLPDEQLSTSLVTENEHVEFVLNLRHEGRDYFSRTRYARSVPIDNLEQGDQTLFDEDDTEVIVTFTDEPDQENFYVLDFGFGNYLATEDTFYKGQQFTFSYFYDELLQPGRELEISLLGATQTFYDYMDLLVVQTEQGFGAFDTPVATVRGNIFDITDLDNEEVFDNVGQPGVFPLGYFAVVQEYKDSLIIR